MCLSGVLGLWDSAAAEYVSACWGRCQRVCWAFLGLDLVLSSSVTGRVKMSASLLDVLGIRFALKSSPCAQEKMSACLRGVFGRDFVLRSSLTRERRCQRENEAFWRPDLR